MALTVAVSEHMVTGNKRMTRGTLAFDSSYPTGGESFTARNMGLKFVDRVDFEARSGYLFEYDYSGAKVMARTQGITTGATAVADATSGGLVLNGAAVESAFRAMGTAASTTYVLQALKEVANTTDLSALTGVRWQAMGA